METAVPGVRVTLNTCNSSDHGLLFSLFFEGSE